MKVRIRGHNFEGALRTFKRKVKESGKLNDIRDKQFYEKKSQKQARKHAAAKLREQRRQDEVNKPRKSYSVYDYIWARGKVIP